tara:strand:- start:502 stop:753 length:252 start_codon:yes stop_codon:yes gene_type:complete
MRSAFFGTYLAEIGALNDFSLNLGISFRFWLRQMVNIPVKMDRIMIPNIKKYDRGDFIFYYLEFSYFFSFDMRKFNLYLECKL